MKPNNTKWMRHAAIALVVLVAACAPPPPLPTFEQPPEPEPTGWTTGSTITFSVCQSNSRDKGCNGAPASHSEKITWDGNVEMKKVLPGMRVTFGPFHVRGQYINMTTDHPSSLGFTVNINVLARSPALFDESGAYYGADPNFRTIAHTAVSGKIEDTDVFFSKDVYVTAKLPSVYTALRLDVSYSKSGITLASHFPYACDVVPPSATAPGDIDTACLFAAVNPLLKIVPKVFPLAIIYEPPGNCSWANLTDTHTAGAGVTVELEKGTTTQTINDVSILGFSIDHGEFTQAKMSKTDRTSQMILSRSRSFGTSLGLPLDSPGNPDCNREVELPARANSGPGKGDLFIFLLNPCVDYWHSENASNFLFSKACPPGVSSATNIGSLYAWQIEKGEGLPPGLSFTEEEKKAILDLDPFTDSKLLDSSLGKRLVFLNEIFSLGQGVGYEENDTSNRIEAGTIRTTVTTNSSGAPENAGTDLATKLTMKALVFSIGAGAGAGASGGSVPDLYTNKAETKIVTTYSSNHIIDKSDESAVIQNFYIKDTNEGLNVALYYDLLYGTFAFRRLPPDVGVLTMAGSERLPIVSWPVTVKSGQQVRISMPDTLAADLKKLGWDRFESITPDKYAVSKGMLKGLLPGLQLDARTGTLTGGPTSATKGQQSQTVVFAVNAQGKRVAQLWIKIKVAP